MLSVIPAADAARYNPADPIADEIYILEAEAANLTRAGAPDVCQQAYYVAQVKYVHAQLFEAKVKPNEAEPYYERTVSLSEALTWSFEANCDPHTWHGPTLAIFTEKVPHTYPSMANAAFFTYPIDVASFLEFTNNLPDPGALSFAEVGSA